MSKTFLVAQREFLENMRTKTFWLGILAAPIGVVGFYVLMFFLADKTDVRQYAILDYSVSSTGEKEWLSTKALENAQDANLSKQAIPLIVAGLDRQFPRDRAADQFLGKDQAGTRRKAIANVFWKAFRAIRGSAEKGEMPSMGDALKLARQISSDPESTSVDSRVAPTADDLEKLKDCLEEIAPQLEPLLSLGEIHKQFQRIDFDPPTDKEAAEGELKKMLQAEKIFAYFVIGENPDQKGHASKYVSNNLTDTKLRSWFSRHATEVIRDRHIERLKKDYRGFSEADAAAIRSSFAFVEEQVSASGENKKVRTADKTLKYAPIAFVYILWMAVLIGAQMLLTNTVEEKSNRIIEVLLSSVSPSQLMHGKIYGIALTGLTVVGSWALFLIGGVKLAPMIFPSASTQIADWGLDAIVGNPLYLVCFLGYFLAGYLLYAAILVAIGSVCNSLKEAQNLQQPVMFALMVPLATMIPIANDPNGLLAKVITYIPIYTPFAMMNRAGGPPPLWEFAASTALILVSVFLAFRGAAKIFRVGVLMTGKPPKVGEVLRWMREPTR